ncbi:variant surface antigen E-like [Amphibalanus amphitrite]|uniref:variant surface antigen E-like n=1 Tax=Amphibalanus amphitrite TaxID=1232801 RepID=UPI001C90A3C1|nr:variant surface antigen E-like [Amphibalanus amphitrite]XP_043199384.1 variant surface antigen E-like [Amphibalanus amphitrite]
MPACGGARQRREENKLELFRFLAQNKSILYGKLRGPGAGAARATKWKEARDLAALLGLIPHGADVRKMRNSLLKNQIGRSRAKRNKLRSTGTGGESGGLTDLDEVALSLDDGTYDFVVPGALSSIAPRPQEESAGGDARGSEAAVSEATWLGTGSDSVAGASPFHPSCVSPMSITSLLDEPSTSLLSQPSQSTTSLPSQPTASQPTASLPSQPYASQPTAPHPSQPTASLTSQPTASIASQPTAPHSSQPTASQPTAAARAARSLRDTLSDRTVTTRTLESFVAERREVSERRRLLLAAPLDCLLTEELTEVAEHYRAITYKNMSLL